MSLLSTDSDFLARFRSGEPKALSQVYCSYFRRIESYIRRWLSRAGSRAARGLTGTVADLVQEAFTHAFSETARLAYDGRREYGRFLTVIARNTLIDFLRRRNREEPVDPLSLDQLLEHENSAAPDEFARADPLLWAFVQHYLSTLPEHEHAVYVLRYAHDQSQLQAADALGLTRQQIRTIEERVRAGLARELAHARIAREL